MTTHFSQIALRGRTALCRFAERNSHVEKSLRNTIIWDCSQRFAQRSTVITEISDFIIFIFKNTKPLVLTSGGFPGILPHSPELAVAPSVGPSFHTRFGPFSAQAFPSQQLPTILSKSQSTFFVYAEPPSTRSFFEPNAAPRRLKGRDSRL